MGSKVSFEQDRHVRLKYIVSFVSFAGIGHRDMKYKVSKFVQKNTRL